MVDPKVTVEGDKVVIIMGIDRLELDINHAIRLKQDVAMAVKNLLMPS